MHIFISGIGGTGVGPLAQIAKAAGYDVSGSDKQNSGYTDYLKKHGITNIHIGQTSEAIAELHSKKPIDWIVFSSAVEKENPNHPEILFARAQNIKFSKRDEFLNQILTDTKQKMIAIAGTHGKTTTTAMTVWLFKQLEVPISYILPAKTSYGEMGEFNKESEYFVYECDEFDRNFLAFNPHLSLITGVSWDHHEIFPTREDYQEAFKEFISQSSWTFIWQEDHEYLGLSDSTHLSVLDAAEPDQEGVKILGKYNRLDAWLAIQAVHEVTNAPIVKLTELVNKFPGLQRRMEEIYPNLFSDYAHTPEKVRGCMSAALELAQEKGQDVVVVFEPLHNRRQHFMIDEYKDCFAGAKKLYWLPSYLAREDPDQRIIKPSEMIEHLSDPTIAVPMDRDEKLKVKVQEHLKAGDMVIGMAGGGGNSLDEWLRKKFAS